MEDRSRRDFLSGVGSVLAAGLAPAGAEGYASEAREKVRIAGLPASDARDLPSRHRRLEVRTLDTPRVPPSFKSRAAWEERAAKLREQILVAAGLWPLPEKTPMWGTCRHSPRPLRVR